MARDTLVLRECIAIHAAWYYCQCHCQCQRAAAVELSVGVGAHHNITDGVATTHRLGDGEIFLEWITPTESVASVA